jgi:hypothetical protein
MTWKERLQANIVLTSPAGSVFTAEWIGNPRTVEKKLGIFQYPKIRGAVVQDLDVGGDRYPLTIFFEGSDHDIEAGRFFNACKENGAWSINHPVRGRLTLQLVFVTETIAPVESGNITEFITEWIEPLDPFALPSLPELASQITTQVNQVNDTAASQFARNLRQDKFKQIEKIVATTNSVVTAVSENLGPIYQASAEINARITSIARGIQDLISEPIIDAAGLAGQIQSLIQLPLLAIDDIPARVTAYSGLLADTLALAPTNSGEDQINVAATQELAATSINTAIAQTVSAGDLKTRKEAIGAAETVSGEFITMTDVLDVSQEIFQQNDIDLQYFSQSESFSDSSVIAAQAIAYLLEKSFSLAIEKRMILTVPRAPIEITITEYGTLGAEDANLDLFLESNQLSSNDIMLLQAGREVVVYV